MAHGQFAANLQDKQVFLLVRSPVTGKGRSWRDVSTMNQITDGTSLIRCIIVCSDYVFSLCGCVHNVKPSNMKWLDQFPQDNTPFWAS